MNDIVVIGGGGHSKVVISILKKTGKYNIIGYTDIKNRGYILGVSFLGNDDECIMKNNSEIKLCAIGIGQIKNVEFRKLIIQKYIKAGFKFPPIVSPQAIINENVAIDDGTVIMDGAVIQTGSIIEKYSIINTKASVDHDCKIGSYVHIAPGATISGNVRIGHDVFIGAGSTIIQDIQIGNNCIVAAAALVRKDIKDDYTFVSNSLRKMK
jgi:sugar O-acyltransferase (sialic acid O-acetyltransferase NeuD family)